MSRPAALNAARPREAGFTLVELLVALGLLAMAAVMVGQALASDRNALRRIERRQMNGADVATAQGLIRERLEHFYAATRYDGQSGFTDFDGQPSSLVFWADAPTPDRGLQVQKLRLALDLAGDLTLGPDGGEQPPIILRGVKGVEMGYWGPLGGGWKPDWTRQQPPPLLVRVRLAFADGDPRVWPELIVHPAVNVNSDCVYDASTGNCRGQS